MANEAFALSPMSARPVEPGEAEYAAISDAFMETSRGRWFLAEFARRNRNADTRLVLDAVSRLEENLAVQKQVATAVSADDNRLSDALAVIRDAVDAARAQIGDAFEGLALEQRLMPVRKGTRIIREISWRLREIGNDGRICDIIDSQLNAIETGAAEITADATKAAIDAAFASIAERLAGFGDMGLSEAAADAPSPASSEVAVAPPAAAATTEAMLEASPPEVMATTAEAETALEASPPDATALPIEEIDAAVPEVETVAPAIEATMPEVEATAAAVETTAPEIEDTTVAIDMPETAEVADDVAVAEISFGEPPVQTEEPEAGEADAPVADIADNAQAEAHDEAILDLIASEMGVLDDPIDDEAVIPIVEAPPVEPQPSEAPAATIAPEADPAIVAVSLIDEPASPSALEPAQAFQPVPQPLPEFQPAPEEPEREAPAANLSLGASLLANGLIKKPQAANDPLAPIRRMSQAEKVAFFS